MRISDWSSDVCSSIAECVAAQDVTRAVTDALVLLFGEGAGDDADGVSELGNDRIVRREVFLSDRVGVALEEEGRSDGEGKSVAVRVEIGGRRRSKKK